MFSLNQQLPAQLTILFLTFIIIITWVLTRHERDQTHERLTQNMDVSTWLLKEKLERLPVHPALDELAPSELINLQIQMNRLRQALYCKLYLIDKTGRLIISDLHGGPMQTKTGQHLQAFTRIKKCDSTRPPWRGFGNLHGTGRTASDPSDPIDAAGYSTHW
ncbi:hypothetical protein P4S72_10740 [Vibrio sp. PP-XX7]